MMKQMDAVSPMRFQAWVAMSGLLALAPFSLWFEPQGLAQAMATGWPFVLGVLYAALITSLFAHTAYYFLIARYEADLLCVCINATIVDESTPPDRNAPSGTSATI